MEYLLIDIVCQCVRDCWIADEYLGYVKKYQRRQLTACQTGLTSLLADKEVVSDERVLHNTTLILSHLSVNECDNVFTSVLPTEGSI